MSLKSHDVISTLTTTDAFTTQRHAGIWIPCRLVTINASSFPARPTFGEEYPLRLRLIFLKKKLTNMQMMQRGLSALAELLVPYVET